MSTSQEYTISRKVSDTEEEIIQIPYDALANKPDLSVYQTKNDASLKTNDKTVVGAINEVVTGVAETLESFGMSLAPQENGKLNNKVYVFPDGYLSQGTSYDASKDLYLSIGDGLTLETIDEANNIWNIKSGSAITSVDGLSGGAISGDVSTSGSLTVGCSLTVNGTTTTVDSTTLQVKDKLIEVAHGNTTTLTTPAGLVAPKYDGTNSGALVFDSTGTAYVGDVKLDSTGNIDVAKSELQPLATRTGLVGGNLVQYDSSALTLKDSGKKIGDLALKTDIPTVVQSTGNSTSDVMSQKAVTDELNKKANIADLAQVATSGNYNDLSNKPTIPANYTKSPLTPSQCTANGFYYVSSSVNSLTDANGNPFLQYHTSNNDFRILATAYSDSWVQQIATDFRSTHIYYRILNNSNWGAWTEIAKISDIPTNYVTTDTDWQEITSTKKFLKDQLFIANEIDIAASAPAPETDQYRSIDFLDKHDNRIGIVGASVDTNKCYGAYLQAGNVTSMGVLSTPDGFGYSYGPIPPNKDNTNKLATTSWTGRRYKSISDFGFTSQTTVKAIVQKIIDNWYEYCTFACTNDNFNNFSDTPEGCGTLIIEVGSNALRPFISFTKQIGDSNKYKHWQANIVRSANNQVTEVQWYEIITTNNFSLSGTTLTITL